MTDSAVKDVQSSCPRFLNIVAFHLSPFIGSLGLEREDLVILFKPPVRSNIYLQVNIMLPLGILLEFTQIMLLPLAPK